MLGYHLIFFNVVKEGVSFFDIGGILVINKQIIVLFFASFFSACNINSMNAVPIAPIAAIGGGVATFAGGARLRQLYGNLAKLDKKKLEKKLKADPDFTGTTEEISDTKEEARERSRIMWKIRSLQFVITVGAVAVAAVFFWKNREKKPDGTGTDNDVRDLVKKILGEDLAKKVFYLQTGDSESKSYDKLSKNNAIVGIDSKEVRLSDEVVAKLKQFKTLEKISIYSLPHREVSPKIGDLLSLKNLSITFMRLSSGMIGSPSISLPSEIGNLTNLEILSVIGLEGIPYAIKALPKEIGNLASLTALVINNTHLESLPQDIGKLKNLKKLSLNKNKLIKIPETIYGLTKLVELNISNNKIKEILKKIGNLTGLIKLDLYSNKIESLPKEIWKLKKLIILNLYENELIKLPETIYDITNLKKLNLNYNKIEEISEKIGNLINLEELGFTSNQLTKLPKNLGSLKKLKVLDFGNNKLSEAKGGSNLKEVIKILEKILENSKDCKINLYGNGFTKEDQKEIKRVVGETNFARLSFDFF